MDQATDKKKIIAETFEKFIFENGLVKTMVNQVAETLHMSKKTIYKYFPGGKEEILYYIFCEIAKKEVEVVKTTISQLDSAVSQLEFFVSSVYSFAKPFVLNNRAQNQADYLVENQIVGEAFRDSFEEIILDVLERGKKSGEFSLDNCEFAYRLMYSIISEAMVMIREDPDSDILDPILKSIKKMVI